MPGAIRREQVQLGPPLGEQGELGRAARGLEGSRRLIVKRVVGDPESECEDGG